MKKIILVVLSLLFVGQLSAQSVGLVLSGGGAKGLYHIGIIQALEENDIPIDYISGTSMGSIVAGLYAAGYSAEEMAEIFRSEDVSNWVNGRIPDKYISYYKKLTPRPSIVSFDLNIKRDSITGGANGNKSRKSHSTFDIETNSAPSSIVSSSQLDLEIMSLTAPVSQLAAQSFDSLFVPYRCVSVDIVEHKEYLWSKGDLGLAIRSSMSIPIVFKPVIIDSMIMYDGGLRNNFPWQCLEEEFAPDILIGGKCTSGTVDPNTLSGQIEMISTNKTDYTLPEGKGIMINRDMDIGMLDFSKVDYAISQGYEDAMAMMPQIKEQIPRRVSQYEVQRRRLEFRKDLPSLVVDKILVKGVNEYQRDYIISQIDIDKHIDNREVDIKELKQDYFNILSEGIVDTSYPKASYRDSTGAFTVEFDLAPKPALKLLLGIDISSTAINQGYIGLQYRNPNKINRIYTLDGYFGTYHNGIHLTTRSNLYRRRPFYLEQSLGYNFYDHARGNSQRFTYKYENVDYLRFNDAFYSALVGHGVGDNSKLEIRGAIGYDTYGYFLYGIPETDTQNDRSKLGFFTLNGSIKRNTLNYNIYPTRGSAYSLSVFGVYINETFISGVNPTDNTMRTTRSWVGAKGYYEKYNYLSKHFNLGFSAEGVYSNQPDLYNSYINNLVAPAFQPTHLSKTLYLSSFRAPSYIALGLKPIFELNNKFYLKTEAYGFISEVDNWNNIKDRMLYIVAATAVYQLPFGPVSFNYSHFDDKSARRDYFVLNIGYTIFNRKGIEY